MRKCHHVYDKISGKKLLIPFCWPVVISWDMTKCNCRNEQREPTTDADFERDHYNRVVSGLRSDLKEKKEYIAELEKDNARLNRLIGNIYKHQKHESDKKTGKNPGIRERPSR